MKHKEIIGIDFNELTPETQLATEDMLGELRQEYDSATYRDKFGLHMLLHEAEKNVNPEVIYEHWEHERRNDQYKKLLDEAIKNS